MLLSLWDLGGCYVCQGHVSEDKWLQILQIDTKLATNASLYMVKMSFYLEDVRDIMGLWIEGIDIFKHVNQEKVKDEDKKWTVN
jgi:hypothetical protein